MNGSCRRDIGQLNVRRSIVARWGLEGLRIGQLRVDEHEVGRSRAGEGGKWKPWLIRSKVRRSPLLIINTVFFADNIHGHLPYRIGPVYIFNRTSPASLVTPPQYLSHARHASVPLWEDIRVTGHDGYRDEGSCDDGWP